MKVFARISVLLMALYACAYTSAYAADPAKYEYETEQLFQPIPTDFTPSRLLGGSAYDWRDYGATATHVDRSSGWVWQHIGGDWIDRAGVAQGSAHWLTWPANTVSGITAVNRYSVDVTELVKAVHQIRTWNALILKSVGVSRSIAGAKHAAAPVINVVYADGTTDALACLYSTRITTSTSYVGSNSPTHTLPAVLEFEKPTKEVTSATLLITVTSHPSGKATITGNLLDPPVNDHPVESGVAANAGPLDAGLNNQPSIIGQHRYLDGSNRSEFIASNGLNIYAERDYDPFIWGRGEHDFTKLPHRDLGKWIAAGSNFQVVDSKYSGEGFTPLAPGLGALRVTMPATDAKDGSVVGYSGTTASIAKIYLPEPEFGRLDRIFVRYYVRWGEPLDNSFANRYQVRQGPTSSPVWTDMGGKFGITPSHETTDGGVSGTSGGGYGWQMRLSWSDRNPELGPPTGGATTLGVHTYDFGLHNPVGYRYGDGKKPHMLGQQGGLGGVMWPGRWYCIEMMVDLNSLLPTAPGYLPDGSVKVWVDGRLALDMPNMVMRTAPVYTRTYREGYIRPARELGIRDLWFNWFHGGKTHNTVDRTVFITGLAWGREYIGPMNVAH